MSGRNYEDRKEKTSPVQNFLSFKDFSKFFGVFRRLYMCSSNPSPQLQIACGLDSLILEIRIKKVVRFSGHCIAPIPEGANYPIVCVIVFLGAHTNIIPGDCIGTIMLGRNSPNISERNTFQPCQWDNLESQCHESIHFFSRLNFIF